MRAVVLGDAVLGYYVKDCCVEGHSVGGGGVGSYCEGRVYVKIVMDGVFRRIGGMLLWNDRTM